jgi:HD-GYP domain-containing protein (c-di-GMP phosphodiesterase class II)
MTTTESRVSQAPEWTEIVEALHGALNVITVRSRYPTGHPARRQAEELATAGFVRVFERAPEVIVALIDGEFIVAERPRPELRKRLPGLADIMLRHDIECFVFQRGLTSAEFSLFGEIFAAAPDPSEPTRARELAQAKLAHILVRFAELRSQDAARGGVGDTESLVPAAHEMLVGVARAFVTQATVDPRPVRSIGERIVARCAARTFALEQRSYAEGAFDLAGHAVNVATTAAAMTKEAGYPTAACVEVAAAALLHDAGHLLLPSSLRGVPEPLLDERGRQIFRHHPFLGARALLAAGCPSLWAAVALEHHRGVDGAGYPAFDSKATPHELVRIVALANFVDRKRTLARGQVASALEALRMACSLQGRYFDRLTLRRFLLALGLYPPGTTVELSDRQAAIVTRANPGDAMRPEVCILVGPNAGNRIDLKGLNAVEQKHVLSIAREIPPPLVPWGGDVEGASAAVAEDRGPTKEARISLHELSQTLSDTTRLGSLPPERLPSTPPRETAAGVTTPSVRMPQGSLPPLRSSAPPPRGRSSAPYKPSGSEALSPLQRVPRVLMTPSEIARLPLDPRAGFLLSFMDGSSTVETVLDACGLPREDAVHLVMELLGHGAIEFV